jgi:ribosomal protein S18 acetylase RimI-like enzyme
MTTAFDIRPADVDEMQLVRALFREYQTWLDVDLCFQGFEQELAALPGDYCAPRGGLWLARRGRQLAGVVALRPMDADCAELKRLWVRPGHRGSGLGRQLTQLAIGFAKKNSYLAVRLDTLPQMQSALALYRSLGFQVIEPYYDNPLAGVVYMELSLAGKNGSQTP